MLDCDIKENSWQVEAKEPTICRQIELPLDADELKFVCATVQHEARGFDMMVAITQCIKNSMEYYNVRPKKVAELHGYWGQTYNYSKEVEDAVIGTFLGHYKVTDEPIEFYYAEDICYSEWHETQDYVMTILNSRFFKRKK